MHIVLADDLTTSAIDGAAGARLLYRAAVDWRSMLLEALLHDDRTGCLRDPHRTVLHQPILLRAAGVPVARAVYLPEADRGALARQVDWLGGFPVVVKRPGFEGGAGISLARDLEALIESLAGVDAMLEAFVPHARAWRMTVLGGGVIAATARAVGPDDFRSNGPGSTLLPDRDVPRGAAAIAVRATRAIASDFGGVDVLESPDGTLTVAEINMPCYFADQQAALRVDIAGAIVDRLLWRSARLHR